MPDPVLKADQDPHKIMLLKELQPFDRIALAFSGGGFRASCFCLGVLSYLYRLEWDGKPLLDRVRYISSASGGTITASMYALKSSEADFDFVAFFKLMKNKLTGQVLLEKALSILAETSWEKDYSGKSHNLINAFARAYDELLFEQKTLGDISPNHNHLEEVCFNATEFNWGQTFRMQLALKEDAPDPLFGNGYICIKDPAVFQKLKLADVLAASSCFPAGFEPMVLPDDFAHRDLSVKDLEKAIIAKPNGAARGAALMDGGIVDNQAIDSMLRANTRREDAKLKGFDLMLVCDVASYFMKPYTSPQALKPNWFTKLNLGILSGISILLVAAMLAGIALHFTSLIILPVALLIALSALGAYAALFLIALWFVKRKLFGKLSGKLERRADEVESTDASINIFENFSKAIIQDLSGYFNKTPLYVLVNMLSVRVKSLIVLSNDVFLKRIRSLTLEALFDDKDLAYRRKAIAIYDLSETKEAENPEKFKKKYLKMGIAEPTENMKDTAQRAYKMGTTLWFDHKHSAENTLRDVVATGQFTVCLELLDYVCWLKKQYASIGDAPDQTGPLTLLEAQLKSDWEKFRADPHFYFDHWKV